jgi:hypothetical protein
MDHVIRLMNELDIITQVKSCYRLEEGDES